VRRGRLLLRWTGRLLFITGALAVIYVAFTLLRAELYQKAANNVFEKRIYAQERSNPGQLRTVAKEGDVLGRIQIPRLGMKIVILEGTTSRTLQLGVGHIEGTALPGVLGNIGVAGHRDTFFRGLNNIRIGDEIQIQTADGLSRYQVDREQIVAPGDTEILAPSASPAITLITCYPFHFIGAAPERFVVHAHKE